MGGIRENEVSAFVFVPLLSVCVFRIEQFRGTELNKKGKGKHAKGEMSEKQREINQGSIKKREHAIYAGG